MTYRPSLQNAGTDMDASEPSPTARPLEAVRARLDEVDRRLLELIDERAALAGEVAAAKAAAGEGGRFALRPPREAEVLRNLLAQPRKAAPAGLIVRIWRELMSDSLSRQGPYHVSVYGGPSPEGVHEAARMRFGAAPPFASVSRPEDAITAARTPGGVAVLALDSRTPWWGRLLAEPTLRVFAALPCLNAWGRPTALAAAEVEIGPTGGDRTYWVTDAPGSPGQLVEALSKDGVAAELMADAGGLRLFELVGYYQSDDERLARAPGRLTGVIGAASAPLDT
jgi:chorismate mutase